MSNKLPAVVDEHSQLLRSAGGSNNQLQLADGGIVYATTRGRSRSRSQSPTRPPLAPRSRSNTAVHVSGSTGELTDQDSQWGGTPNLRKLWVRAPSMIAIHGTVSPAEDTVEKYSSFEIDQEAGNNGEIGRSRAGSVTGSVSGTIPGSGSSNGGGIHSNSGRFMTNKYCLFLQDGVMGTPGLLIALVLNLFLSMSFGQAFFPAAWQFPDAIPRSIGVQMFLLSTCLCQVVMTALSDFPCAMGMMMVENIPFMHILAQAAMDAEGEGYAAFATLFVMYALSTLFVGLCFYLLGKLEIGNAVYFFPRHVIIGCIGGIGIFIFQTGMEISANKTWIWSLESLEEFTQHSTAEHCLVSVAFVVLLRVIMAIAKAPLLPPFYFVAIPPAFYLLLYLSGVSIAEARADGWFFDRSPDAAVVTDVTLLWRLIDFKLVNWSVIARSIPTIFALTVFSLMHVPINIPSLSMSTHYEVNINKELIAHGYANILAGMCGGLQNYLCYSNSLLYYKCKGGGAVSGYLMAAVTAVFFVLGPDVVYYMPRVMPGCLLIHIGVDLTSEALWDSWNAFDSIEYSSIIAITLVMTTYGMTAGLGLGVICAAMTFTLQTSRHVHPIRGKMCGTTLRSSRWRSPSENLLLNRMMRHIQTMQLQGHLFFGNATILAAEVEQQLVKNDGSADTAVHCLLLDFTLVVGIDSSAADTITKIYKICRSFNVHLCYCAHSENGFPCTFPLSETIAALNKERLYTPFNHCPKCGASYCLTTHRCQSCGAREDFTRSKWVHLSSSLDDALSWCEDVLIAEERVRIHGTNAAPIAATATTSAATATTVTAVEFSTMSQKQQQSFLRRSLSVPSIAADIPPYLHQLYHLGSSEPRVTIDRLITYFRRESVQRGEVLWRQGDESERAVLLISGKLQHVLEEEAGTTELVFAGHLVGEFGLLNNQNRYGTLVALEDSEILVLPKVTLQRMIEKDPQLAFVLSKICMAYLGRRVMHVANRIWESHCLPV